MNDLFRDPFRSSISVYEHYSARGNPIKGFFGRWSGLSGLDVPTRARWERRSDLGGAGLVATAEEWRPLNSFDEGGGPVGLMADVMDILRAELNFTWGNYFSRDASADGVVCIQ